MTKSNSACFGVYELSGKRIVLVRDDGGTSPYLGLPGGKSLPTEASFQAAQRKVSEEIGVLVRALGPVPLYETEVLKPRHHFRVFRVVPDSSVTDTEKFVRGASIGEICTPTLEEVARMIWAREIIPRHASAILHIFFGTLNLREAYRQLGMPYPARRPGFDEAVLHDRGPQPHFMPNNERWKKRALARHRPNRPMRFYNKLRW